jgi:S-adenosylmethionine:tRNA ribosyltransferase-isomerase
MIEILLLARSKEGPPGETWEVLLRPAKRVLVGTVIAFTDDDRATVVNRLGEKRWRLNFTTTMPFEDFLARDGRAPLPPYIKRRRDLSPSVEDLERYQTVYARVKGSVAAPTAGLHFTQEALESLRDRGVEIAAVTLHIGYGTFLPIETERVEDHVMEKEWFSLAEETARKINAAARVIAVGTTATRVLESIADADGRIAAASGCRFISIRLLVPARRCAPDGAHLPNVPISLVCLPAGN